MTNRTTCYRILAFLAALTFLVGCSQDAPNLSPTVVATDTINTTKPPTPTPIASILMGGEPPYLDDRSTATSLLASYANAINRKEYLRAYSYWDSEAGTSSLPPFPEFEQGYAETQTVEFTLGDLTGDAGAGQLHTIVPVTIQAELSGGERQTFAGCYLLHLSQPAVQGTPPFKPLSIQQANVQEVTDGVDPAATMQAACATFPQGAPLPAIPASEAIDISENRYLDDRSNAVQVLRSLYNAINRREYVRAYSYWKETAERPPFPGFEQGYANMRSVDLQIGEIIQDAGAGQLYYDVPVALLVTMQDGNAELFGGCYRLHLAQPALQATPPFAPLAIESTTIHPVPSGSNESIPPAGC